MTFRFQSEWLSTFWEQLTRLGDTQKGEKKYNSVLNLQGLGCDEASKLGKSRVQSTVED